MSVDAFALLHIEKLRAPRDRTGVEVHVAHYADASIISTWTRFDALTPDEFSLALRKRLGSALDAHADARGILFFPDVCEFRGKTYDAIAKEVAPAGFWAPKVAEDHIPARYTAAAPGTHDAFVAKMIEQMGREAAVAFDLMAQVNQIQEIANTSADAEKSSAAHLKKLESSLGSEFAKSYRASVKRKILEERAQQQSLLDSVREFGERTESGEPIVSQAELGAFIEQGGADAILRNLDPAMLAALEAQLGAVDVNALADDDLGKQLAKALKRTKT